MMEQDPIKRLTARQALEQFYDIFAGLSKTQLESKVVNRHWENGVQLLLYLIVEACLLMESHYTLGKVISKQT